MQFLTIDLIREEIKDRFPSDNEIEQDKFFSDKDILHAMKDAANMYNDLAPIGVDIVHPLHLPADSNVFMDAVVISLYKSAIYKLTRNLISWKTGDVTVDTELTRMTAFQLARDTLYLLWVEEAKQRKIEINRRLAWAFM